MMDPEDMVIFVAAIFQSQRVGWTEKTCVKEAKEFVRFAEHSLRQDRAMRRQMNLDAVAEVLRDGSA
jgi:hypothetical protein